jgi:hypothetical protein
VDELDGLLELVSRAGNVGNQRELFADVDEDDVCTFFGQTHRMRPALTTGCPGDQRDFTFET